MPELPEVEVTRQSFMAQISHAQIVSVRMGKPLRWPLGCAPEQLLQQTIHQVRRRGKYLILDLDDGVLLIHLGMSGHLVFAEQLPAPAAHDHFDLHTTHGVLRLHDPRRFGAVVWSASQHSGAALKLLGGLGAEPLDPDFDVQAFAAALKRRQAPIKQVLLAGDVVVGVGNIYASEALFRAGIDPRKPACKVSKPKVQKLAGTIQQVLSEAIRQGGTTLRDFRNTHGEHGWFQLQAQVYGRAGEPCLQCGRPIIMLRQGQRSTYFCRNCQK
ncbi:bifunctional DNA-formamidopyrimidine glycosylase/DNA-(apurinic or apyrimidinic site) lyase [Saezia sanguinis]|uniref:bifunctional DNA-formamidopyrimidine glycosylase/DNA-(apurinic or apyrimidinic site) lyase n=1 Tax=Saezia sanguinis TaxID=1965230 RepID=UPI00304ED9D4